VAWLSAWSKVQMICIWSSWCHCHPIISCFNKIKCGFSFWCWLTQVILEKRLLIGCSSTNNMQWHNYHQPKVYLQLGLQWTIPISGIRYRPTLVVSGIYWYDTKPDTVQIQWMPFAAWHMFVSSHPAGSDTVKLCIMSYIQQDGVVQKKGDGSMGVSAALASWALKSFHSFIVWRYSLQQPTIGWPLAEDM